MKSLKTRIAAGATVVGLGGLAGVALSAGQQNPASTVAEKPLVRTKGGRRTSHGTKHAKTKHPAAGGGKAWPGGVIVHGHDEDPAPAAARRRARPKRTPAQRRVQSALDAAGTPKRSGAAAKRS